MNGTDIIGFTRQLLQDDSYSADVILQAANWFIYELANNNRLRLFEDSTELTASAGDTSLPFPDTSLAWTGIYQTLPQTYDLSDSMVDYNTFMRSNANFASSAAGQLRNWTMFGNGMRFAVPLLTDVTIQFDFVAEPAEMESPSDDCVIPRRYSEMIARGTKARILEIEEDYDYAAQERNLLDPLMTTFIRNEARGGGKTKPTIIRTGRRGRGAGGVPRMGD